MSFFASDYNCKMPLLQYLKKWQTKSCFTIKADFIIRVPASTRERPHTKTVGDKVTTNGICKKRWCHYKYSAKERADIGEYSTEVLRLSYLLRHLGNTHTLKLTPSCKFKHI